MSNLNIQVEYEYVPRASRKKLPYTMKHTIRLDRETLKVLKVLREKLGLRDYRSVINYLILTDNEVVKKLLSSIDDPYQKLKILRAKKVIDDPTTLALIELHSKRSDKKRHEHEIIADTSTQIEKVKRLRGKELYDRLQELKEQDQLMKERLRNERLRQDQIVNLMIEYGISEYDAKRILELSETERKKVLTKLKH